MTSACLPAIMRQSSRQGAAPHPYPLPVKDGESGPPAFELVPSPRPSRGEGAGRRMRGGADVKT
ncbi:MAG: hypothetical protein E5X33_25450 [Mesorhizobium sp.]|nr:hypothetical protein EOD29_20270 [Mesorhizobium sp. M1A.T.Ca.IN.004.03.1.1]RWI88827.1 MAG: hypothetical protein EOR22_26760 [Mesorhizobium sp.]RWK34492.1 MAG: hypothetical protein EOR40_17685 [Mesorhizobium sp.]RWK87602.1 MAG: hypothetical protein EOR52_17350 [Mesorhizobium sp.]TIP19745.1 MAG: hypothetical protein E5X66_08730 [Mesorhizobium sp.]